MSKSLDDAKKAFRLAKKRTERLSDGREILDWDPKDSEEENARRLDAITELNRPLTPNESFNIAAGHEHDWQPPQPHAGKRDPLASRPGEHAESTLARQAAAIAEGVTT